MLKKKMEQVKKWSREHKDEITIVVSGVGVAVLLGLAGKNLYGKLNNYKGRLESDESGTEDDGTENISYMDYVIQDDESEVAWMLTFDTLKFGGEPTDMKQIGQYIIDGNYVQGE